MALRTVGVRLTAEVSSYMSNMKRAGGSTRDFVGEMDKAAKAGHLDAVANRAGAVGIALTGMAAYAIKSAADFDKSMSAVKAATHASAAEIGQLREAALQAGKDTQYSATGAADAITELSKAGVSTADVLNGGLKGALSLAAAGQLDVGEAAETAASAMVQFRLSGEQIPHIADLLAAGAGKAQGSVHDMGQALNQSGLVASQFGLSVEDTTGALAAFASAGLTGSDAGTSFKTMLLALANPSEQTSKRMDELGVSAYDAQGKFIGITALAEQLRTKLGGLTQAQRDSTLAQIFGSDAIRSANVLYREGGAGIQKWITKVNDSGYASETAAALTDNLAGDLERLKGSLETMAIESGGGATAGLRSLTQAAGGAVDAFGSLPSGVQEAVTVLSGVGGVSLLAAAGFLKARGTARDFVEELRNMGPAGTKAADGLGRIGGIAGKLSLAGAGAVAAYEGFKLFGDWIDHFSAPTVRDVGAMSDALREFGTTGKVTGELAKVFGTDLAGLQRDFEQLAGIQKKVVDLQKFPVSVYAGRGAGAAPNAAALAESQTQLAQIRENTQAVDKALSDLASTGGASQARIAFQQLNVATGVTIAQLPQYAAAARGAGQATGALASGFGSAEANTRTLTSSLQQAIDAGQTLTDVWTQLNGATLAGDQASLAAQRSVDAVAKSFKENGKAVVGNSLAALQNRVAVGEAAKAASAAAQAKYIETGSITEANKTYNAYIGQLKKTLSQAHLTTGQVDTLTDAYTQMPDSVTTKVSITGDKAVNNALNDLLIKQRALATGLSYGSAKAAINKDLDRNRQKAYHSGGWTGPGGKYDVAGTVHADEFVINKASRRRIEAQAPGALEEMNATGQLPGYAGGGRVWPFPTTAARTDIPSWSEVASKVGGNFGNWPSSPGAQRGDSGVWHKILALVKGSGIPYEFGNAYRPGDPKWHGSGRAIDFMGYNQDRLANFFLARQSQVLELIHRTNRRDYGITRGHYNAMPHQWPLHRNHLHIAMKNGGTITEPIAGVGASGRTYSFGENYQPERVTPNWQGGGSGSALAVTIQFNGPVGSQYELEGWLSTSIDNLRRKGKV